MKKRKNTLLFALPAIALVILIRYMLIGKFIISWFQWQENADEIWAEYAEDYGSFTPDKTYSYDNVFYAVQEVEKICDVRTIKVCIYEADTDTMVYYFYPARAWDFWGICWETDSYNIWTQSADIGVYCYRYDNMQWILDEDAVRPPDIISKYDD